MICPNCQTANPEGARFCLNCGTPLEAPRPVEGERKLVTVLFADVVGSTAMAEGLDPEPFMEIMNGAFAFMSAAVARYGGTIARLMGDAVLAFFGAPLAHEDDPERAVRAALEIREAAREYARTVRQSHGVDFAMRVGIDTGLVVAGEVGSGLSAEYTAMGDTPNVAARLQSAAAPGTVLISERTYPFVSNLFHFDPRGPLALKGKSKPIGTFVVTGIKAAPGKMRGLAGVHSPLVGRDAEFELLSERVVALGQAKGGFVALLGEAGLGKSRLVAEVRERVAGEQLMWIEGRALSYGQSLAYYLWRQVIRQAIGAQESDPPARVRTRLKEEVCSCCKRPGGDLPLLETLLAVESQESLTVVAGLEGDALLQRMAEALEGYLCSLARLRPLVLVFDDLHWADPASLELLARLAGMVANHPLLLLCVLRPDGDTPSRQLLERVRAALGLRYTEIALEPLGPSHSRELLGNLLRIEDLPDELRAVILRKSEGNPFFLEEVLRTLIDSGHVVRENGHWRATREIVNVPVPDTLAGVLSARIDRLPEETKRVAQTAAVLGRIFAHRVLAEVCASAAPPERIEDVDPHLGTLTHEELVRERTRLPELEYIFKHALTQEAAYNLLLVRRRRELHQRAAAVLERLYAERHDEVAAILAHHYLQAEQWERAVEHSRQAGERALRLYALQEARAHYGDAYRAAQQLQSADPRQVIDLLLRWTYVGYALKLHERATEREEILARLEGAERLARELGDERRLARVLIWRGNVLMLAGYPTEAYPPLQEGYRIAVAAGDEQLALLPLFIMTWFMVDNDPRAALPRLEEVIEDARRYTQQPGARELEAHAWAILGMAHARLGEFGPAERALEQALALAPQTRSPIKEADVNLSAAMAYYDMGEIERGLEYSRRGREQALGVRGMECACTGSFLVGFGNLQMQKLEEAQRAFEESFAMAAPLGEGMNGEKLRIRASLAFVRFNSGDTQAIEELEETRQKASAIGDEYGAAFISQMLGESYTAKGDFERARQRFEAALAYYRRNGMRPYIARTLQSLANVFEKQERPEDVAAARAEAEELMRELQLA